MPIKPLGRRAPSEGHTVLTGHVPLASFVPKLYFQSSFDFHHLQVFEDYRLVILWTRPLLGVHVTFPLICKTRIFGTNTTEVVLLPLMLICSVTRDLNEQRQIWMALKVVSFPLLTAELTAPQAGLSRSVERQNLGQSRLPVGQGLRAALCPGNADFPAPYLGALDLFLII